MLQRCLLLGGTLSVMKYVCGHSDVLTGDWGMSLVVALVRPRIMDSAIERRLWKNGGGCNGSMVE